MFASVLPGIREARVPLAAGVLWLSVVGVAAGWVLPAIKQTLLTQQLLLVADSAGVAAGLAALSFLAYLVGVSVMAIPAILTRRLVQRGRPTTALRGLDQKVRREIRAARLRGVRFDDLIDQFDDLRLEEETRYSDAQREENAEEMRAENPQISMTLDEIAERDRWTWLETQGAVTVIRYEVLDELSLAELSLQARTPDVYDKYDRLRAEGDFRRAVAPAIGALFVAVGVRLAFEYSDWVPLLLVAGALPAVLLWRSGTSHLQSARDMMIQAILGGQASSPTLKLMTDLQAPI